MIVKTSWYVLSAVDRVHRFIQGKCAPCQCERYFCHKKPALSSKQLNKQTLNINRQTVMINENWTCKKCGSYHEADLWGWAAIQAGFDGITYICISCFYVNHWDETTSRRGPAARQRPRHAPLERRMPSGRQSLGASVNRTEAGQTP